MIVIVESIWDQIEQKDYVTILWNGKELILHWEPLLKPYIDIFDKQYSNDNKKINTVKELRGKYMILKSDKGNGIVLWISKVDYYNAMKQLFSDKTKFKIIKNDPTLIRLKTVQRYLNNLCKRNEITEAEKKQMWPLSAQPGCAPGLPKIHKGFHFSRSQWNKIRTIRNI